MPKQTVKIKVEFEDEANWDYNRTFTFELIESPAFEYGNGTAVRIYSDKYKSDERLLDTRYTKNIVSNFEKWCTEWLSINFTPHKATIVE